MRPGEGSAEAARQELEKVLSSAGFTRSERLSRFLRFVVERHLEGKDSDLKEPLIAVEIYGRRPDYDPKQDSIVRTEAARLRSRLTEYYAGEGTADALVIELPKGGYAPVFHPRDLGPGKPKAGFRRIWLPAAVAGLALALIATGWWLAHHRGSPLAVAVLPLDNLSHDPANDYFADGLTDELIRNLSVIDGLAVRSRTSSFALKGKSGSVREAGQQLGADYILEGSVLRAGQQLRVNVQLIRVRDDFPLWSGRFERELVDVFTIQDEISRGIVNNLRVKLGRGRRRYETSVEAYDLYLRARGLSLSTLDRPAQAIGFFQQAIAKDPAFAPAYAGMGTAYAVRSVQFPGEHPSDELVRMRAAAEKAMELDPLLGEAHDALGMAYAREGQWTNAEKSFLRAIDLDPNRSETHADYALWLLRPLGRNKDALDQLHVAEKADPLSEAVQASLADILISSARYDDAVTHCVKLPDGDEKSRYMARARIGQGKLSDAIQILSNAPDLARNPQDRGFLGYAYARSGRREEAEMMAAASEYANEQALIFAGLGDKDRTLSALDRMAALGPQRVGVYLNYPELELLRNDRRVSVLRKKIGLP
jgi:serine/threonine-protein kinase